MAMSGIAPAGPRGSGSAFFRRPHAPETRNRRPVFPEDYAAHRLVAHVGGRTRSPKDPSGQRSGGSRPRRPRHIPGPRCSSSRIADRRTGDHPETSVSARCRDRSRSFPTAFLVFLPRTAWAGVVSPDSTFRVDSFDRSVRYWRCVGIDDLGIPFLLFLATLVALRESIKDSTHTCFLKGLDRVHYTRHCPPAASRFADPPSNFKVGEESRLTNGASGSIETRGLSRKALQGAWRCSRIQSGAGRKSRISL